MHLNTPLLRLAALFATAVCVLVACGDGSSSNSGASNGAEADTGVEQDAASGDDASAEDTSAPEDTNTAEDTRVEEDTRVVDRDPAPENDGIYGFAHGCVTMDVAAPGSARVRFLEPDPSGDGFVFAGEDDAAAARFLMHPSDLGTYLFYDADRRYFTAEDDDGAEPRFPRVSTLDSDILLVDDTYVSPAEWELEVSIHDNTRFQLRHYRTKRYLTPDGLAEDEAGAAIVTFYPAEGCVQHPELTLDAVGEVDLRTWDDGDLFGVVETHGHLFTNFGFGGGGIFHGSPFHRLGVEHALSDCSLFHGEEGRQDIVSYALESGASSEDLLTTLVSGETPEANHATAGYPDFTFWPNSRKSKTHQTMYYKWLERAWLGGLRLFVQHATGNSVLCELVTGSNVQPVRYSCNDMISVDREIEETYKLERYIDAMHGGPGEGWFRIVTSPSEARQVIRDGKLAVVLGIEISNLFDCFITPQEGIEVCDADTVREKLDDYHDRGVRALFPVHKYDNGFSPGDGARGVIELGNFINSGHWSNFTEDCPDLTSIVFDDGDLSFGGINRPRDDYLSPAPNDLSGFGDNPVLTLLPFALDLTSAGSLQGDFCQNATLTGLGETLMREMMSRGMIIEVDHLPRRAYVRAYEMLVENDYPAAGTHGRNYDGLLYALGGVSKVNFGRCADPENPDAMVRRLKERAALSLEQGGYPAEGFGFDFNGFAGGPGPRFGDESRCGQPQDNPIDYPFTSFDGAVTFEQPNLGSRTVDFNTEGMIHIGLLPELIEDVRRGGATDADLEPLFRSAEGYIRMWERSEARAQEMD